MYDEYRTAVEPAEPIAYPPPSLWERDRVVTPPPPSGPKGWLVGIVGGVVGALIVGAAWFGVAVFGSDDAAPTTTAAATTAVTTVNTPTTITPSQVIASNGPSVAETAAAVIPSIVTVQVGNGSGQEFQLSGTGSGVIVDSGNGYVVTNDHVASAGPEAQVILSDGRIYEADLVGTDPLTDLAVLRIGAEGLTAIRLGDADALVVGDSAIAVGSPLGLEGGPSVTVGYISAFDRQVQTGPTDILYGMLQTDAPITNGSSGGALVDAEGRLIGITTAVGVSQNGVEGIGFATPIEIVRRVVDELIADGTVRHAFLGITGRTAFSSVSDGGSAPAGVEILTIEAGTAAAGAGLAAGDIITSVDGTPVDTMEDLIPMLRRESVGNEIAVAVNRSGETLTIAVVLGVRTA